jgi:phospholipid/cholesterol/gamma-HCH transport system substrate-binding protein
MRRANTTFLNLRAALDDVDPLVRAAEPAVERLGPFLNEARLFARDAEPTVRDLSRTISRPGSSNDLIELIDSFPPLSRVALDTRGGAFPTTTEALDAARPTLAFARPYTPEFVGWMDDFSTTGGYDALGGYSRAWINLSELLYGPGPKLRQFRRCPGANEMPASDGSNVFGAEEAAALDCDPSQRSVGP